MKKILGVLVALLLVLVAAPWVFGRFAEGRINRGLDALAGEAPQLRITERHWQQGWFHSEQDVIWEVVYPADKPRPPAAKPIRFTVRNQVLHGPVLWSSGLGLARVDTHIVLGEELRARVIGIFGTPDPWQIRTRVKFIGGATTVISGKGRTIDLKKVDAKQGGTVSWDDFHLAVAVSRKAKSFTVDGSQPRLEVKNDSGTQVVMSDINLHGSGDRLVGELYASDMTLSASRLSVKGLQGQNVEVAKLLYKMDSKRDGDFIAYSTAAGTGDVDTEQLRSRKLKLQETHFDLTLRHLHIPTLAKLMATFNHAAAAPDTTPEAVQLTGSVREQGLELLRHDPELVIDRIGFVTPEGAGWIKGSIRLVGAGEPEFSFGMGLLQNLQADIHVEADQAMLEKFPGGATALGLALDQGMAVREGKKLVSRIQFKGGELSINGKSRQVPGMRPPPKPVPQLPTPAGA